MKNTNSETRKKVAIIGAGIIGVSTAIWLQRDGHDVVLIDLEGPAAGASFGNGGVLAASAVIPVNEPGMLKHAPGMLMRADSPLFLRWSYLPKLLPWLLRYLSRANVKDTRSAVKALSAILHDSYEQHLALASGTGAEKWLKPSDYVFVYDSRADFEKERFGWDLRKECGFEWDEFDADTLNAYDPVFSNDKKFAIRLTNHGYITDPGKYVCALADHVKSEGGEIVIAKALDVESDQGKVVGVRTSEGLVACDHVVLAAGVWSGPLAKKFGVNVPLESERGYHIELVNPSVMPKSPIMLVSGKFVVTPMEGRLRCAGIVEFGGLDAPPSKAPFALLKKQILQAIPGIKYDEIIEWMGHRPATVDSVPVIGPVNKENSIFAAFGHQHIGLTGGPKTGRMIADMIENRKSNIDLSPYKVSRFDQ
ncbi:MAG: FAD-binding oxidoreductase [Rhizobiaceae bacterium]|nr:FAD-binding oxidoreductase [Rhizobiaceae bacterium]